MYHHISIKCDTALGHHLSGNGVAVGRGGGILPRKNVKNVSKTYTPLILVLSIYGQSPMYWSVVSMWLSNFSLIEQRKVISSLLSKTSVARILNIFVGHGKIYVSKEWSIADRNIYNFNWFSFKWFWWNFKYFCFVACSAWYSNTSVESSQSPKRVFIIY